MIKHPDIFRFGVSGAPVVDWRYYDTIYTERYMGLLSENQPGYNAGSCLTCVSEDGIGKMLLIHGAPWMSSILPMPSSDTHVRHEPAL